MLASLSKNETLSTMLGQLSIRFIWHGSESVPPKSSPRDQLRLRKQLSTQKVTHELPATQTHSLLPRSSVIQPTSCALKRCLVNP
jgi:hypothetical protein